MKDIKFVKYNHPAFNERYKVGKGFKLEDILKDMKLDKAKRLFKPVNFQWSDLEPKRKTIKKDKSDKTDNKE